MRMPDDVIELFAGLGLAAPDPIPVMAVHHQVAQKLHAVTFPGNLRAHDLVDLQLLAREPIDIELTRQTVERLFRFRAKHAWTTHVVVGRGWDTLYLAASQGLDVARDVDTAVAWANDFIDRLAAAELEERIS
jgi:hypothetical protein